MFLCFYNDSMVSEEWGCELCAAGLLQPCPANREPGGDSGKWGGITLIYCIQLTPMHAWLVVRPVLCYLTFLCFLVCVYVYVLLYFAHGDGMFHTLHAGQLTCLKVSFKVLVNVGTFKLNCKWILCDQELWNKTWLIPYFFSLLDTKNVFILSRQVIPKMTTGIASEVDHLLGNRPHSKKDYQP